MATRYSDGFSEQNEYIPEALHAKFIILTKTDSLEALAE